MGLSLRPERLKRYKEIARVLFKYGRSDLVARAGLDEALSGEELDTPPGAPDPQELPKDLETLGPAFIKLGQVLSTRADLLPPPYLQALGRLQDQVEPFPFADVQDVIEQELLLASLIIGAAMLMRIETTFRIFGYPGLAMLFFLVAASGALWLAFTILTSDQAPKRKR